MWLEIFKLCHLGAELLRSFAMYYVGMKSWSSLLVESTDSMIEAY